MEPEGKEAMSEEVAAAAADLAHIARLQEQLNHWKLQAEDAECELAEARALLAGVRHYVMRHGILIGECVAWNVLKLLLGVGQSKDYDDQRWAEYQQREGTALKRYYTPAAERIQKAQP
jgi:hypothetical protein